MTGMENSKLSQARSGRCKLLNELFDKADCEDRRFQFVTSIAEVTLLLVVAFANSISANVKGCSEFHDQKQNSTDCLVAENPDQDSHADDDE